MNELKLSDLQLNHLKETQLKTYSPTGRARGYEFNVVTIDARGITVRKQNGKEQTANWREVSFVEEHWSACKAGEIRRQDLAKKASILLTYLPFSTLWIAVQIRFDQLSIKCHVFLIVILPRPV